MTAPTSVSGVSREMGPECSPESSRLRSSALLLRVERARPKSVTRARPSSPINTLVGLKSRCTNPAWWAASSPRPAPRKTVRTSRHSRGFSLSQVARVTPRTSSIVTKTDVPSEPTSYTGTTWGCDSWAMACASRSSRLVAPVPCEPLDFGARSTLMATRRSSTGSYAAYTRPMPPAPSTSSTT